MTIRNALVSAVLVALMANSTVALAANPTFSIIGPAEWDMPIVPSANIFLQSGVIQDNNRVYNANGDTAKIPQSHIYEGISRFAHLFSYESLPKVGFAWEVLLPEVRIEGSHMGISGMGDPMFDIAAYVRPSPNWLVGFQNIVSIPVGGSQVTNNRWVDYPSIISDVTFGKFGLDTTLGVGLPSTRHKSGEPDQTDGTMYMAEAALRYQALPWLAPFIQYNYQYNNSGHIHDANHTYIPSSRENVLGGGAKINFTPGRWLSIWYNKGISGRNTVQTNAIYLRFVNVF